MSKYFAIDTTGQRIGYWKICDEEGVITSHYYPALNKREDISLTQYLRAHAEAYALFSYINSISAVSARRSRSENEITAPVFMLPTMAAAAARRPRRYRHGTQFISPSRVGSRGAPCDPRCAPLRTRRATRTEFHYTGFHQSVIDSAARGARGPRANIGPRRLGGAARRGETRRLMRDIAHPPTD